MFRARLVGRDVQPLVDLLGVRDDDLGIQLLRQPEGQLGLANARRSDDDWDQ
jgi:hypothetical protein